MSLFFLPSKDVGLYFNVVPTWYQSLIEYYAHNRKYSRIISVSPTQAMIFVLTQFTRTRRAQILAAKLFNVRKSGEEKYGKKKEWVQLQILIVEPPDHDPWHWAKHQQNNTLNARYNTNFPDYRCLPQHFTGVECLYLFFIAELQNRNVVSRHDVGHEVRCIFSALVTT